MAMREEGSVAIPTGRKAWLYKGAMLAVLAAVAVVGATHAAQARYRYHHRYVAARSPVEHEAILLDADTGQVLSESNADALTYPASLTKMMTLYLTFQALNTGRLHLDQRLAVSEAAADKAPTKLGLTPGDAVSVRSLILGIVTKSANDAAAVLAEGQAGSEAAFADRMNREAQALGMTNTFYRNASGLPDPEQHTTARDVARLALALYHDFPREYRYFSVRSFDFRGRTIVGHDHLLEWYPGADGIKTGFINASGFNLASSAVQNGHRLIGVIMGGATVHSRDMEMAAMLDRGFAEVEAGGPGPERGAPAPVVVATAAPAPAPAVSPAPRYAAEAPRYTAEASHDAVEEPHRVAEAPRHAKHDVIGKLAAAALHHLTPVSKAEAATLPRDSHVEADRWGIQIGAFHGEAAAERAARAASRLRVTRGKPQQIVPPERNERNRLYLARLLHFTPRTAHAACLALHKRGIGCEVVRPDAVKYASR